ncbi:MAG: cysteine--tRNA ligase [bacterium]|nr:cysteine--tRNA ligase [bacterium]
MLKIYNTLSRKVEEFTPFGSAQDKPTKDVGFYACGPTVYNYAHIGNLRAYIAQDILRRTLKYDGYKVKHVMNITDVGHLTDDADEGEDKMEKGAEREGKTALQIADYYTDAFMENLCDLNILEPNIWCKATEHIPEQIKQVQDLIDGGFTYETTDGIYFDTTKINDYGKLAGLDKQELEAGKRVNIGMKKNPHDFALWKWSKQSERHPERAEQVEGSTPIPKRQMEWEAFGHVGFPGWHIECSAMAMKYLGDQFDLHAGGIDHIPVHHTNEIAQAESVTGLKPWVKYWFHNEFLIMSNEKMSKSSDNFITLQTLKDKNIDPLSYRYFLLQSHYRKQTSFSWEALEAAQLGLKNLKKQIQKIAPDAPTDPIIEKNFFEALNNDLNTPEALALLWNAVKENQLNLDSIIKFDKILGLNLHEPEKKVVITDDVQKLLNEREKARKNKDWVSSDTLRDDLLKLGFEVEDTPDGQKIQNI